MFWNLLLLLITIYAIARTLRFLHLQSMTTERYLGSELGQMSRPNFGSQRSRLLSSSEIAAYSGLTVSEFIWSWATIDSSVILASDFSSTESISNHYDFVIHTHNAMATMSPEAAVGYESRLLGYAGEQHAAALLTDSGHSVEVAHSANQSVWDLIVDGHHANIKTVAEISSIKAEALANQGVTYYVPEDATGHLTENMVRLSGFSHDDAKSAVHHAVSAAKGEVATDSLGFHWPLITVAFAAYRNYQSVKDGKSVSLAVEHTVIESVGRGVGVIAGGKIGSLVGLPFGPVGAVIGAVIGGIGGAVVGNSISESVKQRHFKEAQQRLSDELHTYGRTFANRTNEIWEVAVAPIERSRNAVEQILAEHQSRKTRLEYLFWPDFETVAIGEAVKLGKRKVEYQLEQAKPVWNVLREAKQTGRYEGVGVLLVRCSFIADRLRVDQAWVGRVMNLRDQVLTERKKLNPSFVFPK